MALRPFFANVRQVTDAAIIDLHGEIHGQAEYALNEAYAGATATNPATVVLNFTDVDYINSTGIALIVGLLAQARKSRRHLRVYGLSDHYVEIFQITRLADFMHIFANEASALI
ncbi:MAG: STAS domain-containing protein [Chloroflexota bacterium]|nr:STAS domain-containing protein [Chloroflexota bacterium]